MADSTTSAFQGKQKVIYVRKLGDTAAPLRVPFQTTHNFDPQRKNDSTATKDGNVTSVGGLETSFEIEALNSNDPTMDLFENSLLSEDFNDSLLEIWEVNYGQTGVDTNSGKFRTRYAQISVNEISEDNDADDLSQKDITCDVYLKYQWGWGTISKSETNAVQYAFKDLASK